MNMIQSSFNTGTMTHSYSRIYTEQKKSNVIYIIPKLLIPKRYICVFISWQTSESHLHKGFSCSIIQGRNIIQALTENIHVSNSEKNATRMRNDITFHFFKIYEYLSIKKNGIYSKSFNSQLKEIKGQTVYHFEIISLSIKRISFLYLLISCTFRKVLSIIS